MQIILAGLKEHEKVELVKSSCLNPSSEQFGKAFETKCKGWDSYFQEKYESEEVSIFTEELGWDILDNPNHPVTELLLYLQTLDHWLSRELNSGLRDFDQAKIDNLGPFAYAFGWIIDTAGRNI